MKCPSIEQFEDFLHGELTAQAEHQFEEHFKTCPACRMVLERERRLDELLRGQSLIRAPEGFTQRVLTALTSAKSSSTLPDWLQAFALGLIVTFLGVFFGRLGKPLIDRIIEKIGLLGKEVNVQKGIENLGILTENDWGSGLFGGNELFFVNVFIGGLILCWGLWQMIKALRG